MGIINRIFKVNAQDTLDNAEMELRASELAIETANNKLEACMRTYTAEIYDCKVKRAEAKGHLTYLKEALKLNLVHDNDNEEIKEEIHETKTIVSTLAKAQSELEKEHKELNNEKSRLDKNNA
jgi:F0F1-type ATP synthase membrane subunit b/b'